MAIFLSVIMLTMAFNTCRDAGSCEDSDKTELSKTTDQASGNDDVCSPFCHCLRCPFSILLPSKLTALFNGLPGGKKYPNTSDSIPLNVSIAVWQPPKAA